MRARPTRPELMDDPAAAPEALAREFRFIRWVNRRLKGAEGLLYWLRELKEELSPQASLLDVGTGCGDIPLAASRWGRAHGMSLSITGFDRLAPTVSGAAAVVKEDPTIELVEGDAFQLAARFEPRSFDIVHAGMFLHHFREEQVVRLLALMGAVARKAVIWNDLSRDFASRAAIRLMTLPLPREVRHDSVLSVDKGFLPHEIGLFGGRAGLSKPRLRQWRFAGRFSALFRVAV